MKICHIITGLGIGGAEKLLANMVNIQCNIHEITIIYFKGRIERGLNIDSRVKLIQIPLHGNTSRKIREHLLKNKQDIVHTHLGHADLLGLWAARGLNINLICTMHNIWFKFNYKDQLIFFAYRVLLATVAKRCKVICISQAVADHVTSRLKIGQSRIKTIYNGIPGYEYKAGKQEIRSQLKLQTDQFLILFIGRLEKQKNVETLLKAIKILNNKIQNFTCLILGDGSKKDELIQYTENNRLTGVVTFKGIIDNPTLYYKAADIFVLPSIFEGLGIVLLESFRASLPVVASNIEGPKELIRNNFNGLLFEPLDPDELATKIVDLYKDNHLREMIGKNGFTSFANKFEIHHYVQQVEQVYISQ